MRVRVCKITGNLNNFRFYVRYDTGHCKLLTGGHEINNRTVFLRKSILGRLRFLH